MVLPYHIGHQFENGLTDWMTQYLVTWSGSHGLIHQNTWTAKHFEASHKSHSTTMHALAMKSVIHCKSSNTLFLVKFSTKLQTFLLMMKQEEKLTKRFAKSSKLILIFLVTLWRREDKPKGKQRDSHWHVRLLNGWNTMSDQNPSYTVTTQIESKLNPEQSYIFSDYK